MAGSVTTAPTNVHTSKNEADRTLAEFWRSYVAAGRGGFRYVARNPFHAGRAFLAVRRLPIVDAPSQSDTPGGWEVGRIIDRKGPLGLPDRWWGFAVLPVIQHPADFLESPGAKRLRRNLRLAEAEGISCSPVPEADRAELLERANHRERNHPDETYRVADPRNDDLLWHDLWLVARDKIGQPLLLVVAAIDGQLAGLRYFRTYGDSEQHSLSRYLAHQAVVEALASQGVHWLMDNEPPAAQTNGVRLFQRIVGFRHIYVRRPRVGPAG